MDLTEIRKIFSIKIGGQAGQGVKSAGLMLSKIATRSGYHIYNYTEYPSLIRGGHNTIQINISQKEVTSASNKINFLIALNKETIDLHLEELLPNSGILFDAENKIEFTKKEINFYPIPMSKLAQEAGGTGILVNTVALGATTSILKGDLSVLENLISEEFYDKEKDIIDINIKAAELGYKYAEEKFKNKTTDILIPVTNADSKIVINGNDAIAIGAIAGGLQFAAIYPMSPISNILHTLAYYQEKFGYIYKQPEDEISAINMAIGASFAGARSMTATSGGGFSLMAEGYGLAGMTETPVVIINGMRPGPATGLATWSEQGDLQFILHTSQGDLPRIVLSAGDAKEAFELTMKAFNLAEKYQTPVVVLVDKNICEDEQSFPNLDISSYNINRGKITHDFIPDYKRYQTEEDGISLRSLPGKGNFFIANSYEHDTTGFSTEKVEDRNQQVKKRMTKLETCKREDMEPVELFGQKDSDVTIVSWGSNKGPILSGIKNFNNVNFVYIKWISPFPKDSLKELLEKARHIINIECNYTAQMADLIKEKTGIEISDKLLKYDGRPFFTEEIIDKINSVLSKEL